MDKFLASSWGYQKLLEIETFSFCIDFLLNLAITIQFVCHQRKGNLSLINFIIIFHFSLMAIKVLMYILLCLNVFQAKTHFASEDHTLKLPLENWCLFGSTVAVLGDFDHVRLSSFGITAPCKTETIRSDKRSLRVNDLLREHYMPRYMSLS